MLSTAIRLSVIGLLAVLVAACGTLSGSGLPGRSPAPQKALTGAERGTQLGASLSSRDRQELRVAALSALEQPNVNRRFSWSGDGASGTVKVGPAYLVTMNGDTQVKAPYNISTDAILEPVAGDFVTQKRSNIRLGPSTDNSVLQTLDQGVRVRAIGVQKASNWYLVARGDEALGYIFGELIAPVPGGDLLLAGGEPGQLRVCREMTHRVQLANGLKDAWYNGACRVGSGFWSVFGGEPVPTS
ncbi:MAG: SH3 domain-containing protein [Pseudomonadota bacterium]